MAKKTVLVTDLTGTEITAKDAATVTITYACDGLLIPRVVRAHRAG